MYMSKKLEKLKAVPQWVSLACGGCGMGLLMLFALGYWVESIIAVVFTVAGWSAGYIEAKSWYARLEEERQLWWENRYLRQREGKSDE
jgi:hypothetical protein